MLAQDLLIYTIFFFHTKNNTFHTKNNVFCTITIFFKKNNLTFVSETYFNYSKILLKMKKII